MHSSGQPVTVPQRCERAGVSQAQYFTLLVQNNFNSPLHCPTPNPIKKLLDPERPSLARTGNYQRIHKKAVANILI